MVIASEYTTAPPKELSRVHGREEALATRKEYAGAAGEKRAKHREKEKETQSHEGKRGRKLTWKRM